jgi:hypothetical protein
MQFSSTAAAAKAYASRYWMINPVYSPLTIN